MNAPKPRTSAEWTKNVCKAAAFAIVFALGAGCDRLSSGGSADETSTVAFYRPDGRPAAAARVSVYGSADTGVEPRSQVVTDADGRATIPSLDKGFYNLLVLGQDGLALFQDSLYSNGGRLPAASDTLLATGILTGRLKVQPQHSPRIAWVHLLGTGRHLNVDDSGFFRLERLPRGRFTLAAMTRQQDYTPTFKEVSAVSDSIVDVGTIELIYTGLPVVRNLMARFDTLAGLVHLRWDSLALRQTWRYNVYRDDILLGQTTGVRWIDTVSDEYPGRVPGQGLHTYRVSVANADIVGSKWESITMRIISAYLYEEVKIDWEKKARLPWAGGLFRLDTAEGELVCWRSAEYGFSSGNTSNEHIGWIQKWRSLDSGVTWTKELDSLPLGALPYWFNNRWWSVLCRRNAENTNPADSFWINPNSRWRTIMGVRYDTAVVVTSSDGGHSWDSIDQVVPVVPLTTWHFEANSMGVVLVGGCYAWGCKDLTRPYYTDRSWWQIKTSGISALTEGDQTPRIYSAVLIEKTYWSDSAFWKINPGGTNQRLNGTEFPSGVIPYSGGATANDYRGFAMGYFLFREQGRWIEFGTDWALSMDTTLSKFHQISWPGRGLHFEMRYGGGILSASDSGIYLGRIRPGAYGDPRGTWTKKTDVPAEY